MAIKVKPKDMQDIPTVVYGRPDGDMEPLNQTPYMALEADPKMLLFNDDEAVLAQYVLIGFVKIERVITMSGLPAQKTAECRSCRAAKEPLAVCLQV